MVERGSGALEVGTLRYPSPPWETCRRERESKEFIWGLGCALPPYRPQAVRLGLGCVCVCVTFLDGGVGCSLAELV